VQVALPPFESAQRISKVIKSLVSLYTFVNDKPLSLLSLGVFVKTKLSEVKIMMASLWLMNSAAIFHKEFHLLGLHDVFPKNRLGIVSL
jgi:hypothetical protein